MKVNYLPFEAATQAALASGPFHVWRLPPDDAVWCAFHREADSYRLRFPDLADFLVSADGHSVQAFPTPGLDQGTLDHLYLNQVLPLALSTQGAPVFHASAVALGGQAISFAGESGRGKSTLATSLVLDGACLLTDDGLVLEAAEQGYRVQPSHPSVRLWDDSRKTLVGDRLDAAPPVSYTSKSRLLAGAGLRHCEAAAPLCRAYFLGTGETDTVQIMPMSAVEAAVEWVKHSFLLDIEERPRLSSHFSQIGKLAALGISYRLDYPRDYERLPDVRRALLDHLAQTTKAA